MREIQSAMLKMALCILAGTSAAYYWMVSGHNEGKENAMADRLSVTNPIPAPKVNLELE